MPLPTSGTFRLNVLVFKYSTNYYDGHIHGFYYDPSRMSKLLNIDVTFDGSSLSWTLPTGEKMVRAIDGVANL